MAIATVATTALIEQRRLAAELESESAILHRLASQRADQHDAHMTSLSVVAVAGGEERFDFFLEVAATIRRFYPRITAVDLVPLSGASTRSPMPEAVASQVRSEALASQGQLAIRAAPDTPGAYLLVKRSPNSAAASYGLAIEVDAAALIASDAEFWLRPTVTRSIRIPDGALLSGTEVDGPPGFSK